jgi:hypothetical protein
MGQGYAQGQGGTGGGDTYGNRSIGGGNGGGYGGYHTPTASDAITRGSQGYSSNVPANPMLNTSVGGGDKPFSGYQRPSGYSPWMRLYDTPTNGGTVSPYSATVQPAMQQQQYNQQVAEQIQGVRNTMINPHAGTPGIEMPVNGAGLSNPYGSINYVNPMGTR